MSATGAFGVLLVLPYSLVGDSSCHCCHTAVLVEVAVVIGGRGDSDNAIGGVVVFRWWQ